MKSLLFYFSGTGNTWWLVDQFVQKMNELGHSIEPYSIEQIQEDQWETIASNWERSDRIGFAYPIYGSDAPKLMKRFIRNITEKIPAQFLNTKPAYVLTTVELFSGDGALVLNKELRKLNLSLVYAENFQMVSNLGVPMITYNPCSSDKFEKRKTHTLKRLDKACDMITANKKSLKNRYNFIACLIGGLQRVFMGTLEKNNYKYLGVDPESCTRCMLCVDSCPSHAISFPNDQFSFNNNCTACFRCYNFCPTQSITVFGRTADKKRHRQHKAFIRQDFYSLKSK